MRAILIDTAERKISVVDLPVFTNEIREKLGTFRVATLPNGDTLNVLTSTEETFSLGGSPSFSGSVIVLGRRGAFGEFRPTKSALRTIAGLTMFGTGTDASRVFGFAAEESDR
jgi:hypothetical protein